VGWQPTGTDQIRQRQRFSAPVGRDDIVDAAACLVTAQRIAAGSARTFPPDDAGGPDWDARGLRMEIVA
jgi:predicted RNase H-like nuclease